MPGWLESLPSAVPAFVVAFGAGLLIGVERERRKGDGQDRAAAGVRTFVIVALLGAIAGSTAVPWIAAVLAAGVVALTALSYWRSRSGDPGLTTEVAMLATFGMGVLATQDAALAAGLGALVALLLAARTRLHAFARAWLSDREVYDAILLAGAALIVLPLLPDRPVDPLGAINPHLVWRLTVIVMLVNAAGYVALRLLGPGWGLPVAGLFGGFVSSVATIAAMGRRSRDDPALLHGALAGAALSSVGTVLQLALVLGATRPAALGRMATPLAAMGLVAVLAGLLLSRRHLATASAHPPAGRAFDPRHALLFAAVLAGMMIGIALLGRAFGASGVLGGAILGGFLDTHSAAASVTALDARGALAPADAVVAVALAVTANSVTKLVSAGTGGREYFLRLAPSLVAMIVALWLGVAATRIA
ncbi:MAG: DUF4010 domain-containing protein [Steroidobacteraceae bacterium]|nr:DUF4010 domain-containing protein [Steroidobacteraceae bacterium]